MLNSFIIGNLGADAEVHESNGNKFISMRVAHSEKWTDQEGQEHTVTQWVDVTMNGANERLLPYLKQGVKICAYGRSTLRVYSSPAQKKMVAGMSIAARELELVGGNPELVPRELIQPETGALIKVTKYYNCDIDTSKMKKEDVLQLVDKQGRWYNVVKGGWVQPVPEGTEEKQENAEEKK